MFLIGFSELGVQYQEWGMVAQPGSACLAKTKGGGQSVRFVTTGTLHLEAVLSEFWNWRETVIGMRQRNGAVVSGHAWGVFMWHAGWSS